MTTLIDAQYKINNDGFNLKELDRLFKERGFSKESGKREDFIDAKNYILRYIFALKNGDFIINENNDLIIKSSEVLLKTIFCRIPKELKNWYLTSPDVTIYDQVCIPHAQLITGTTINTCKPFLHKIIQPYENCTKKQKEGVKLMLDFFKEVWAYGNEESYEYILNWFSNMAKGNKNETVMYLKAMEGIGKSTGTSFIMKYVIGRCLSIESNSEPLRSKYNNCLNGKLLVVFEELENTSSSDWELISKKLKTWTTSDTISYEDKYMKSYVSNNINNYIVNSNNDAIKNSAGRRYYICDLNCSRYGDNEYWEKINKCMNNEIGEAFYTYLIEKDTSTFKSNIFTQTIAKNASVTDLLITSFKFIKFNYLLCQKDINTDTKTLYDEYIQYCSQTEKKAKTKRLFLGDLREININYVASNSKCKVNVSLDILKEISIKFNWLSEHDSEELPDNVIWKQYNKNQIDDVVLSNDRINAYELQIQQLKNEIAELKKKSSKKKIVKLKKASSKKKIVKKKELTTSLFTHKNIVKKKIIKKPIQKNNLDLFDEL